MDTVIPPVPDFGVYSPALPQEAPMPMPRQSFGHGSFATAAKPDTASRWVPLRRASIFGATAALTVFAAWQMYEVLQVGGLTFLEAIVLALFVALFAWIALSFVSSLAGFVLILLGGERLLDVNPDSKLPELAARTALLLPTYNEDPRRVFARIQAIYESVRETERLANFDFFILSDSTDPSIWMAEEAAFLDLRAQLQTGQLFYRHRLKNVERKAGNIAEWVTRFGGAYQLMIVLDADSLMQGDTIVRLAAAMEQHPTVGLIQTLPSLLNGRTLFARLQQFAGRVYGPVIASGIAWWHGAESNYWGHNAIIRVAAFAASAGLPVLSGRKVFGGHVLSHDFVEAALMRRAGWAIHMAPQLIGSYEESPPTLTDYAVRDRRWCQGNLQHIRVLPARGLHWVSRMHLLIGIGSYLTAPLWLAFLLVGILISLQAQFIRPEYFPSGATLFPQWPAEDPVRAAYVFAGTMALLLVPKVLGWLAAIAVMSRPAIGGSLRGFTSLLLEIVISALIAPIMMVKQCRAVCEILLGRDAGWSAQRRDEGAAAASEALRRYGAATLLGLVFGLVAWAVSTALALWMLPVIAGLLMAIPVAALTASTKAGEHLRAIGLLLIPEERFPPKPLVRANELVNMRTAETNDIPRLLGNPNFLEAHMQMIGPPATRRKGEIDIALTIGLAKMEDAGDLAEAVSFLEPEELFAVLASRSGIDRLEKKFLTKRPIAASIKDT